MSDPEEKEFSESFQMVRLNTTGKSNEDKADQSDASLPQIKVIFIKKINQIIFLIFFF